MNQKIQILARLAGNLADDVDDRPVTQDMINAARGSLAGVDEAPATDAAQE